MKVSSWVAGRVGSELATLLDREGQDVTVLDITASAFSRLPVDFHGETVVGNGTDVDVLRRMGPVRPTRL